MIDWEPGLWKKFRARPVPCGWVCLPSWRWHLSAGDRDTHFRQKAQLELRWRNESLRSARENSTHSPSLEIMALPLLRFVPRVQFVSNRYSELSGWWSFWYGRGEKTKRVQQDHRKQNEKMLIWMPKSLKSMHMQNLQKLHEKCVSPRKPCLGFQIVPQRDYKELLFLPTL